MEIAFENQAALAQHGGTGFIRALISRSIDQRHDAGLLPSAGYAWWKRWSLHSGRRPLTILTVGSLFR